MTPAEHRHVTVEGREMRQSMVKTVQESCARQTRPASHWRTRARRAWPRCASGHLHATSTKWTASLVWRKVTCKRRLWMVGSDPALP